MSIFKVESMRGLYCTSPDDFRLHDLPSVALQHVCSMLPANDLLTLASVSKKLLLVSRDFARSHRTFSLIIPSGMCLEGLTQLFATRCDLSFVTGLYMELCNEDMNSTLGLNENVFQALCLRSIKRLHLTFGLRDCGLVKKILGDFLVWINGISGQVELLTVDASILTCLAVLCRCSVGSEPMFPRLVRLRLINLNAVCYKNVSTVIRSSPKLRNFVCGGNVSVIASIPKDRCELQEGILDLMSIKGTGAIKDAVTVANRRPQLTQIVFGIAKTLPFPLINNLMDIGRSFLSANASTLTKVSLNHLAVWFLSRSTHVVPMRNVLMLDVKYDFDVPNKAFRRVIIDIPLSTYFPSLRAVKVFDDEGARAHLESLDTTEPLPGFGDVTHSVRCLYMLCSLGTYALRILHNKFPSIRSVAVCASQLSQTVKIFRQVRELGVKVLTEEALEHAGAVILGISSAEMTNVMQTCPGFMSDFSYAPFQGCIGNRNGLERITVFYNPKAGAFAPMLESWLAARFKGLILKFVRYP